MSNILDAINRKLHHIQSSDEATKKRWLIGLSALAMIPIIALWVMTINFAVSPVASIQEEEAIPLLRDSNSEPAAGPKAWVGMAIDELRANIVRILSKITAPNQLEIKKERFNFIPAKNLPSK